MKHDSSRANLLPVPSGLGAIGVPSARFSSCGIPLCLQVTNPRYSLQPTGKSDSPSPFFPPFNYVSPPLLFFFPFPLDVNLFTTAGGQRINIHHKSPTQRERVCGGKAAYLWDLKEYCMCPQELQGLRQSREKRGGRREKEKCKVQKHRLETAIPLRTKQILTQSSHRQLHRRAGRSPSKATKGAGDHGGKAE